MVGCWFCVGFGLGWFCVWSLLFGLVGCYFFPMVIVTSVSVIHIFIKVAFKKVAIVGGCQAGVSMSSAWGSGNGEFLHGRKGESS